MKRSLGGKGGGGIRGGEIKLAPCDRSDDPRDARIGWEK